MKCSIFAQHFFPFQNTLKLCSKYQYKRYSTSSLSLCSENNISDSQNKVEFLFTPDILQNIKQRLQQIPRHRISAPHRAAVFGSSFYSFFWYLTELFCWKSSLLQCWWPRLFTLHQTFRETCNACWSRSAFFMSTK
jgi:hypothetical protein